MALMESMPFLEEVGVNRGNQVRRLWGCAAIPLLILLGLFACAKIKEHQILAPYLRALRVGMQESELLEIFRRDHGITKPWRRATAFKDLDRAGVTVERHPISSHLLIFFIVGDLFVGPFWVVVWIGQDGRVAHIETGTT